MPSIEIWIALGAVVMSAVSLTLSYAQNRKGRLTSIRPVLVFLYDRERGWIVQNIGTGPALNLIVADAHKGQDWSRPYRLPSLAQGDTFELSWIGHENVQKLGIDYTDFSSQQYATHAENDLSTVHDRWILPGWKEGQIGRHWWKGDGNKG